VLSADGRTQYAKVLLAQPGLEVFPIAVADLPAQLPLNPFSHFFVATAAGPLEVCGAPIQPSDDDRRQTPPRGWYFVARLWDRELLQQLGELTEGEVQLGEVPESTRTNGSGATLTVLRPLPDWWGRPLTMLSFRHRSRVLYAARADDRDEILLFALGGALFLAVSSWALRRWVVQPLSRIADSLENDRPQAVAPLLGGRDEFAHVARLVHSAAAQKQALRAEVAKSAQAEAALKQTLEERARLGRNLHDGVIQSIYATGLTLQGIGPALAATPAEAQRRLDGCIQSLNTTIAELRRFIAGTEAAPRPAGGFKASIAHLVERMQAIRPGHLTVRIDDAIAQTLSPEETAQLLMICREAVSNALRHSHGARIDLSLTHEEDQRVLAIADDGEGFDPASGDRRGRGIDNMVRRAEEIGAALEIGPRPGHGTLVRVELRRGGLSAETT
jgi:signal transduction histidine kinase